MMQSIEVSSNARDCLLMCEACAPLTNRMGEAEYSVISDIGKTPSIQFAKPSLAPYLNK